MNVPVLAASPWSFELEVSKTIALDDGEVFICKIKNILADQVLADRAKSIEQRIAAIAPARTTCQTYFSWAGKALGAWGEPMGSLAMGMDF